MMMMIRSSLFVVVFVVCLMIKGLDSDNDFKEDESHILVLDENNFDEALKQFKYLLVEFYAPWCLNCKEVAPEYSAAAKALFALGAEARLAKVDATDASKIAERYGVRGYPTVILFEEEKQTGIYKIAGKKSEEIVSWVEKKTGGNPAKTITLSEQITALKEKHDVLVMGFFKDGTSESAKNFLKVADEVEDLTFAVSPIEETNLKHDTVVVFKKLEEERVELTEDLSPESIRKFIEINRLPIVIEFGAQMAPKIFENKQKKHVILFHRMDDEEFDKRMDNFTAAAKQFKGKALFMYVDVDLSDQKKIYEFFELKSSDCPTLRFVNLDVPLKYRPDESVWKNIDLFKFVQDVLDEKKQPYLNSEEIPEDWDNQRVKILVGKNFEEIARNKTKDVFVHFYASWSSQCEELVPIFEKLAEILEEKNPDVMVAKIDGTKNEVEGLKIQSFPTLKFFPKNSDEVFDFTGKRTLERLVKFVERGGKKAVKIKEKSEEKEQKDDSKNKDEL